MSQVVSIKEQCDLLSSLSQHYQGFSKTINTNLLEDLSSLFDCFIKDAEHAQNENRLLRIGIIGQIKRGKSSFLNSLLFKGKNVLPKAATPMTAALTKISYAETPKALIEFYSKNEWQNVANVADAVITAQAVYQQQLQAFESRQYEKTLTPKIRPIEPEVSDEQTACVELFNMMKSSKINLDDHLGKTISLDNITSHDDLVNELNNYVGVNGGFTPIVKSTELQLNIDSLKNIEVVDTPGMNDPIISRGRKTQEFIGQCDVIFFLSNTCAFLDMHDMGLLAQNIPNKGIEDIILIGSRFDDVLLDVCDDYADIGQLLENVTNKLSAEAEKNVANVCQQHSSNQQDNSDESGNEKGIMQALQNALPPLFVSSMCYDLANKVSQADESLDEQEQLVLDNLNGMYEDFTFTDEDLVVVANFDSVNEELSAIRTKKEDILAKRFTNLLAGSKNEIKLKLTQIAEDVSHKRKILLEGDVESLAKKQQAIVKRIESGKAKVANIFEKYSIKAEKNLVAAKHEIQQDALHAKQVDSQSGSRQESYTTSREVSNSCVYKPWTWGSTKTVSQTHYRTVSYTYANVHESVVKLETFILHTSKHLFETSTKAINLDSFKSDIKNSVKDMFDFTDNDFDPDMILMPLSNAVERITIPAINLDLDQHIATIREQFNSSTVEGDEISQLRNEQSRVVALLLTDIAKELEHCTKTIVKKLADEESTFVPSLTKDLIASVEQLKQDLAQKEQALSTYDEILALVKADIAELV